MCCLFKFLVGQEFQIDIPGQKSKVLISKKDSRIVYSSNDQQICVCAQQHLEL